MRTIKLGVKWIDYALPEGFPVNTSTIVSGPGSSGKPLIGYIFASGWLRSNGSVVFLLTSTTFEYLKNTMRILGTDLDEYSGRIFVVELDPTITDIVFVSDAHVKANFVKPEVWEKAIMLAENYLGSQRSEIGLMIVGAALNLLFFSPTYGKAIHLKIKEALEKDKSKTYFLTVNSDAFKGMVEELEASADNLMFSRMKAMKLYLKIARMKGVAFRKEEIEVPLSTEVLTSIKKEAEKGKKDLIPIIRSI
jgi:KaiC/GvpD/RAD55 family RecA-like ATPase